MRSRFRLTFAAVLAAAGVLALGLRAQGSGTYARIGEIHIGGAARFDYLTADPMMKRLYVSHGTEAVVIDLSSRSVIGTIADTPGIHGIAPAPDLGKVFTSDGQRSTVSVVDAKTLKTLSKVDTGGQGMNPDAITYDPMSKHVWAFNHSGHSAVEIDAASAKLLATVPLSGTAETGQVDPGLGRVYVNIEDKDQVDVIDIRSHKVIASWPVAPAEGPTGMAIDLKNHRIFVGGGPAQVMIDGTSGKVLASASICRGTDATQYDPGLEMSFSSCSDGHIAAIHIDGPNKMTLVQTIATLPGARTMALDTATHDLFVAGATPDPNAPAAPPQAGRGRGRGAPTIPDSFHVEIYGMKR